MGIFKRLFGKKELKPDLFETFRDVHEGRSTENINKDSLPPVFNKMVEDTQVQRQNLEKYWDVMLPVFIKMDGQKSILDLKDTPLSQKNDSTIIVPSGEYENIGMVVKASNPNFSETLTFGMMDMAKGLPIKEVMTWSLQNLLHRINEISIIEDNGIYKVEGLKDSTSSITFLSQGWDYLRERTKIEDAIIFAIPSNSKLLICENEANRINQLKQLIRVENENGTKLLSKNLYLKQKNQPLRKL